MCFWFRKSLVGIQAMAVWQYLVVNRVKFSFTLFTKSFLETKVDHMLWLFVNWGSIETVLLNKIKKSLITKLRILLTWPSQILLWCPRLALLPFFLFLPLLFLLSPSSELPRSWIPGSHLGLRESVSVRSKLITLSNTLLTQCSNEPKGMGRSQLLLRSSFCCSGHCPCRSCCRAASALVLC